MQYLKPSKILSVLIISMIGSACSTINPYTGQQQTSRAITYGALGGVVCGLVGAIESGQRARNAALGCGAIGAGVGAYMDAQEAEMQEQLAGSGVQVQRVGDEINLVMPGNISFNTNEFAVRDQFYSVLDSVAQVLAKFKDTNLVVTGHTDSSGSADYNYNLSNRRATSVTNALAARGVDQSRLISEGIGPDQPLASSQTESGKAQNRRVELKIIAQPS